MTMYLVNQTKSYTLAVSKEIGEVKLALADDLRENLKEMLAEADTSTDAAAGFLDILGDDAALYLGAVGELIGIGAELASGFADGGIDALEAMLADIAQSSDLTSDFYDRLGEQSGFGNFGTAFIEMPASGLDAIEGYGQWDGDNPSDFHPADKNGGLMDGDFGPVSNEEKVDILAKLSLIPMAGLGGIIVYKKVKQAVDEFEMPTIELPKTPDEVIDDEVNFIPADPDGEYSDLVEGFTPPWVEAQMKEGATYGQTLVDPNSEKGVQGTKEFDPEAELDGVIMWDKDHVEDAITAAEAQEAADFHYVSTTTPVDQFEFNDDFGKPPSIGGGEDFQQSDEGIIYITHGDGGIAENPTGQVGVVEVAETSFTGEVEDLPATGGTDHFDFG